MVIGLLQRKGIIAARLRHNGVGSGLKCWCLSLFSNNSGLYCGRRHHIVMQILLAAACNFFIKERQELSFVFLHNCSTVLFNASVHCFSYNMRAEKLCFEKLNILQSDKQFRLIDRFQLMIPVVKLDGSGDFVVSRESLNFCHISNYRFPRGDHSIIGRAHRTLSWLSSPWLSLRWESMGCFS